MEPRNRAPFPLPLPRRQRQAAANATAGEELSAPSHRRRGRASPGVARLFARCCGLVNQQAVCGLCTPLVARRTGGQSMNSGNGVGSIRFLALLNWKLILSTLILLVTVPGRPSPIQHARLKLVVQVSELSNLIYQLDCLSGFANCSQNSYLHLWTSTLDWTAEDQSQLEQWRLLRAKYHGPIALNQPQFQPANLPWNGPTGLQLDEKFSVATFHAVDEKSLSTHWAVIVAPADLPRLESIVG